MFRALVTVLLGLTAAPTFAQPAPPTPYPIAGRLVRFGIDPLYPTIPGDLIGIAGNATASQNNGILMGLPSLNAVFNCDANIWTAQVYAAGRWAPTAWGGDHTGYYPIDNGAHGWLEPSCRPLSADDVITLTNPGQLGILRCHGYDGNLVVPGDLQPGANNGVLFSLWAKDVHIIKRSRQYHLSVYLGSVHGWNEAVYSVNLCDFDPPSA
jgi:hypothetical protein